MGTQSPTPTNLTSLEQSCEATPSRGPLTTLRVVLQTPTTLQLQATRSARACRHQPIRPIQYFVMARKKKPRAIVQEFDAYFGAGSLDDWQRLCRDVGLDGDYSSITQCRKASISPLSYVSSLGKNCGLNKKGIPAGSTHCSRQHPRPPRRGQAGPDAPALSQRGRVGGVHCQQREDLSKEACQGDGTGQGADAAYFVMTTRCIYSEAISLLIIPPDI